MLKSYSLWITSSLAYLLILLSCQSIFTPKAFADMNPIALSCTMSIDSLTLSAEAVMLEFTLTNSLDKKLELLTWYTPFEGFLSDLFVIINKETGEPLIYQGPMVKRIQPDIEDYLTLPAMKTMSTTLNLSQTYQFSTGSYLVKLKRNNFYLKSDKTQLICDAPTIAIIIK